MPDYDSWESLVAAAEEKCSKILESDVRPVLEKIVLRHIFEDIYSAYQPKEGGWVNRTTYGRRFSLLDEKNLYHELQDGGSTLMVTSWATPSPAVVPGWSFHNRRPGAFLQLLESDNLGIWHGGFPRPAITNAQRDVDRQVESTSSEIGSAIVRGIERHFK